MTLPRNLLPLVLMGGVMLIDGFDLNAMPLAVPHLLDAYGLEAAAFGIVFSAVLVGLGAGALLLAPLGDRIGRRPAIVIACLALGFATLGTASTTSIAGFALWRLVTGVALGACLPNISALSAELAPDGKRATAMAVVSAGIAIGAMSAGFAAPEIVEFGSWRMLFILPGMLAIALALALWLALPAQAVAPSQHRPADSKLPLLDLFRAPYLLPFAIFAGAYAINAVALYMLTSWIPTLLPREQGFDVALAARISGLLQGGGLLAGIGLSWLLDRWNPGLALACGFAVIALAFLALGLTPADPWSWGALLLVAGGGVTGIHMAVMALTPSLFPSHMLSSAIGAGVAIARLGAIAGPMVGAQLVAAGSPISTFFLALVIPPLACVALALLVPRALRGPEI